MPVTFSREDITFSKQAHGTEPKRLFCFQRKVEVLELWGYTG